MMKKIIYFIIVLLLLIFATLIILAFSGNLYFKVKSYISPNNEYKIVIKGNGPRWSFGSEDIKIYAYKNNFNGIFNKILYKTEISNDGSPLNDNNFSISWEDNVAILTLKGEGNQEEHIEIKFADKITIKKIVE